MEKAYFFDNRKFEEVFDELYPRTGVQSEIDYHNFTNENFEKLKQTIIDIVNDPKLKDKINIERPSEEITCLPEETKKIFEEIFKNPDLVVYGHGGAGKEIIEGEFQCRYPNLGSHFIQLEKTNESLDKLNHWPHKDAKQIAILVLNQTEYNPIYKDREQKNDYDTDHYSIPNEYFLGYYDNVEKQFHMNPNFKIEHEHNKENNLYKGEGEYSPELIGNDDEDVKKLISNIVKIRHLLSYTKKLNLSKRGYIGVKEQILEYLDKAEQIQQKLNIEQIIQQEEAKKQEMLNNNYDDFGLPDFDLDNWDINDTDWDIPEENQEISNGKHR